MFRKSSLITQILLVMGSASAAFAAVEPIQGNTLSSVGSAAGSAATAEAKGNSLVARRLELANAFAKAAEQEPVKALEFAKELLKLENEDAVIDLIKFMVTKPNASLVPQIKHEILAYPNARFVTRSLVKAGRDLNPDINIIAADLLIDEKEDFSGLEIMTLLIKRGYTTQQVADIFEYSKDQKAKNDIRYNLGVININKSLPEDVRVFALLITISNFYVDLLNEKKMIIQVLKNAKHDYVLIAEKLLDKSLDQYKYLGIPFEILEELTKNKDTEIAEKARKIVGLKLSDEKQKWQKDIDGEGEMGADGESEISEMTYLYIRDFLSQFGDVPENIAYLLKVLDETKNKAAKKRVLETLSQSNLNSQIAAGLIKCSEKERNIEIESGILKAIFKKGFKKEAFRFLPKVIRMLNESPKGDIDYNPLTLFGKSEATVEFRKYLEEIIAGSEWKPFVKALAVITLGANYGVDLSKNMAIFKSVLEDKEIGYYRIRLILWELGSADQRTNVLEILKEAARSGNQNASKIAKESLARFPSEVEWRKFREKQNK
jgi:hypothetical protein